MAGLIEGMNVRLTVRDGATEHRIVERRVSPSFYEGLDDEVHLVCACGAAATMRIGHEVAWYGMHIIAPPGTPPGDLAAVYAHAVQAVAAAQARG